MRTGTKSPLTSLEPQSDGGDADMEITSCHCVKEKNHKQADLRSFSVGEAKEGSLKVVTSNRIPEDEKGL